MGKLICIEGPEGSGKSTCIEHLKEEFKFGFLFTREPGGTAFAERVGRTFLDERDKPTDSLEQLLCVMAARSHHMRHVIAPALKTRHVVTDRFSASTFAYQIYAQPCPERVRQLFHRLEKDVRHGVEPAFWIMLDVESEVGARRAAQRRGTPSIFDEARRDFHEKIRKGLLEFIRPRGEHVVIDTTDMSEEEVARQVRNVIHRECRLP